MPSFEVVPALHAIVSLVSTAKVVPSLREGNGALWWRVRFRVFLARCPPTVVKAQLGRARWLLHGCASSQMWFSGSPWWDSSAMAGGLVAFKSP